MVSLSTRLSRVVTLSVLATLSACAVVPYEQASRQQTSAPEQSPRVEEPEAALIVPQQPERDVRVEKSAPSSLPAAKRMRQLASAEGDKGDYQRAVALLERALRISPRDPETYYELARNHLLLDNPEQALQLAQRGLSLNPSASQRTRLDRLIDACREKLTA